MAENNGQANSSRATWVVPVVVLAIVVAAAVVWRYTQPHAAKEVTTAVPEANIAKVEPNGLVSLPPGDKPPVLVSQEVAAQPIVKAQVMLDDVIKVRRNWNPAFENYVGRQAPDFDLGDVNGTNHKLSNYKGINVMLIFWATWCGPCKMEMPGLIELRKEIPTNKLAMLAISYEKGDTVRSFLAQRPLNYTVIATPQQIMPPPYADINAIPATFFIDKDGIIRLATEGLLQENEVRLILKALD
jgi:peroxiredoxin